MLQASTREDVRSERRGDVTYPLPTLDSILLLKPVFLLFFFFSYFSEGGRFGRGNFV